MKKLHLGSGGLILDGYINTDFDNFSGIDFTLDASKIPYPFEEHILDEILSAHMIEHIEYELIEPMVREWYRVLRYGGIAIVDCPDFFEGIKLYKQGKLEQANAIIFGNNERPTQHHRAGWTYKTLSQVFNKVGFKTKEYPSDDYHINLGIPTFRLIATK